MSKLASAATLTATPRSIEIGQSVQFELVFPRPPPAGPYIHYGFNFDDDSGPVWTTEPRTAYPYHSLGVHHASAVIRVGETLLRQNIFRTDVEVHPRSHPTLSATASAPITPSPPSYTPSATASATGESITPAPTQSTNNVATPTATHSPPKHHTATPTPVLSNGDSASHGRLWIFYVVSVGLAAAALYGMLGLIKPTFHPHADWGELQRPLENLTINYELHFHSNVSARNDRLAAEGPSLILRKTKQ